MSGLGPAASARIVPVAAVDPLVIHEIEFLGGMAEAGGWRPSSGLPEIAFSGRSNVGKSSLLNRLVRRRALARVSQTPGKTREINFFRINDAFTLVDLPGYGYARVSKDRRELWKPLIEGYLQRSPELRGVVELVDARHPPSTDDVQMLDFLSELGVPTIVVATKVDKLPRKERDRRIGEIARELAVEDEQLLPFSAVSGEGRDELASAVVSLLDQPSWRSP
ncbi:MAG: ribosome biogenesis GTP-binding protein YihA/YsxC [Gemmatimonadaceae bacterium]